MSRDAQEQRQQRRQARMAEERLQLPKEGMILTLIGSLALTASFFLPAIINKNGAIIHPYRAVLLENFWQRPILPLLYALGMSALFFKLTGRLGRHGAPITIWAVHLSLSIVVILSDGFVLMNALLSPKQGFGTTMSSLGLLCWLPIFVQFVVTWFRKKPLEWKVTRVTWLAGAVCLLAFTMQLLNAWYDKNLSPMYGLYLSMLGSLLLVIGSLRAEPQITRKERYLGMLSS
ncbi:MAG: hypothetical protein H6728_06845 [Myxococcales bacterium]|nr:hypothetical protein [Myxococcales bacterium]